MFSLKTLQHRDEVFQLLYQFVCQKQAAKNGSNSPQFTETSILNFVEGVKQMNLNEQQCIKAISLLSLSLRLFSPPISLIEQLKTASIDSVFETIFALAATHPSRSVLLLLQSVVEDIPGLQASGCLSQDSVCQIGGAWLMKILKACEEVHIRLVCEMIKTISTSEKSSVFLLKEGLGEILCERMKKATLKDSLMAICCLLSWICQYGIVKSLL